jgi:nucleotide-binding universal stress UspA family protein
MEKTKKILIPTDLSENSRAALRLALSLDTAKGVEIVVLHVAQEFSAWDIPDELSLLEPRFLQWEADRILREANLDLSRFLGAHRDDFRRNFVMRMKVVRGAVGQKIIETACLESADLIVMSPKPRGTFRSLFSRSITERVTREAPCPVLSVCPPRMQEPAHGWLVPLFGSFLQGSRA